MLARCVTRHLRDGGTDIRWHDGDPGRARFKVSRLDKVGLCQADVNAGGVGGQPLLARQQEGVGGDGVQPLRVKDSTLLRRKKSVADNPLVKRARAARRQDVRGARDIVPQRHRRAMAQEDRRR